MPNDPIGSAAQPSDALDGCACALDGPTEAFCIVEAQEQPFRSILVLQHRKCRVRIVVSVLELDRYAERASARPHLGGRHLR